MVNRLFVATFCFLFSATAFAGDSFFGDPGTTVWIATANGGKQKAAPLQVGRPDHRGDIVTSIGPTRSSVLTRSGKVDAMLTLPTKASPSVRQAVCTGPNCQQTLRRGLFGRWRW